MHLAQEAGSISSHTLYFYHFFLGSMHVNSIQIQFQYSSFWCRCILHLCIFGIQHYSSLPSVSARLLKGSVGITVIQSGIAQGRFAAFFKSGIDTSRSDGHGHLLGILLQFSLGSRWIAQGPRFFFTYGGYRCCCSSCCKSDISHRIHKYWRRRRERNLNLFSHWPNIIRTYVCTSNALTNEAW